MERAGGLDGMGLRVGERMGGDGERDGKPGKNRLGWRRVGRGVRRWEEGRGGCVRVRGWGQDLNQVRMQVCLCYQDTPSHGNVVSVFFFFLLRMSTLLPV